MEEENKQEENKENNNNTVLGVLDLVDLTSGVVNSEVIVFLKDQFNIVGEGAVELATKLPKAVIEKIESFDGSGLKSIAESVSDTISSFELPDIDFSDIDIDF